MITWFLRRYARWASDFGFRVFSITFLCLLTQLLMGATREAQWQKVESALNQALPKTAITNLEPIIQGALRDRAYAEAVKAIGRKIALEGQIEGSKPEEKITRLETEIGRAPVAMVPVLHALLAHWYWQYFQENRWRFQQRTATASPPGKDFTAWDLPRLYAEIDLQFGKALAADQLLKATPISAWNDLLVKGTVPDSYRPTLYDFIAYDAIGFYSSGEQAAAKPEEAFELSATSPVFDSAAQFLAWTPAPRPPGAAAGLPSEHASPTLEAIRLYQDLLRFHQNDPAPALAFAGAELERLTFGWNQAFGEEKNARYRAALERFTRTYADFDISALALEREARVRQQEGDLVAAHQLAEQGARRFPGSLGGKLCHNLVVELEAKSITISAERVWNCFTNAASAATAGPAPSRETKACPKIKVSYRNLDRVFFRAIPYDWEGRLAKRRNRPEDLSPNERQVILATAPALEWSASLTPTIDYQEKHLALPAPAQLRPGPYFIVASADRSFGEKENFVSLTAVWVSDLALVTRTREGRIEGFVLDANSGEPLAGARLSVWRLDPQGNWIAQPVLTADENGFFSLHSSESRGYILRARYQGREVATTDYLWASAERAEVVVLPAARTVFFTDRALYRPGQIIQYKGICLWVDQEKDNYQILKGEELTVLFRDHNGKEIAHQKERANDFGSFAGSFTAPREGLMGQMMLQVEGRAQGQAWVQVEEYKRPKFQVTLDSPKTAAKLGERVVLAGHAMSYNGAAVDGGRVRYRVVREARRPWWWGWYGRRWPGSESQEIAHGTATTAVDGSFNLEFIGRPDPRVPESDEPTFAFHIDADVTDSAGETRSAEHVIRVGYTALEATLSAEDWQTPQRSVTVTVHTQTLDEQPQAAEGKVRVYALQAPAQVHRASLGGGPYWPGPRGLRGGLAEDGESADEDLSNPNNWPLGQAVAEAGFATDTNGLAKVAFNLPAGAYRAVVETQDRFGKKVTGKLPLQVLEPDSTHLGIRIPHLLAAPRWELQPSQEFLALWGTGYEQGRAFIEIEHRGKMIQRYWTRPGQTQQQIKLPVTEAMRGGFTLHVTQVGENRAYLDSRKIQVPWENKELEIRWEHFISKLQPGQKETWTVVVTRKPAAGTTNNPFVERTAAEMVAALYDESLDAFTPQAWPERFDIFREDNSMMQAQFANQLEGFEYVFGNWAQTFVPVQISYRAFPPDLAPSDWANRVLVQRLSVGSTFARREFAAAPMVAAKADGFRMANAPTPLPAAGALSLGRNREAQEEPGYGAALSTSPKPDLGQVTARKNLNETACFSPQLTCDAQGVVRLTFTMPEALTKWRFLGFAHDQQVRSGHLEAHAVTSKDLMVQPNPPRFLREGDTVEFTVKVSNQSDQPQTGAVRLNFSSALTGQPADSLLGLRAAPGTAAAPGLGNDQSFAIPAKESRTFSWRITVPDGCPFLTYKAVGAAATVSDGEEGAVPVLSRRILVTESLPLPIRGPGTKKFEFTRLLKSGGSKTLQNQSLTVQMVSQPAWYAVLALPYLMEYPYECSEQTFNRFYANTLARQIANGDPKIRRIFDQWKSTSALDSPLEKNQDLKSVALEETPWLRQAESESQARRNVGILFDANRLDYESARAFQKLAEMQLPEGAWPWFPGGPANDYITLYITAGFGRLRHLGADLDVTPAVRAWQRLDARMAEEYDSIQSHPEPEKYVPGPTDALYLYARSFFLKDRPVASEHQKAIEFFLDQSRKFWLQTNCRQAQAQLALALSRFGAFNSAQDATPKAIMDSLRERSVSNEEMGMFWRDTEESWWWYRAPIETQALMIEAFDEVAHDAKAFEDCRVWLLKQKQTQDWKTTKATADAVYALLLRGRDLLSSDTLVQVKLDGLDLTPGANPAHPGPGARSAPEPGTGFYEVRFSAAEIKPKLGEITVKKDDPGVAWGSVTWQYLEDMTKVTPYAGTPLTLKKTLFTKQATSRGLVLEPLPGPVQAGDELVVRLELRVDRDMEYVHLKDQRGSGTEPVNVLSQYKYQDGLAYYESTRDTASHIFIDYLPKGTYVFEYSTRVQLRGQYQTGVAEIQCLYAPEFNSHSASVPLVVR